jgi:hypothetical protein
MKTFDREPLERFIFASKYEPFTSLGKPLKRFSRTKQHVTQLSRNDAVGSATVPARKAGLSRIVPSVALAGVPPGKSMTVSPIRNGAESHIENVFGGTPKTAVETTALPKTTKSFRLRLGVNERIPPKMSKNNNSELYFGIM